jgi:coronin-1B/1C/6
LISNRHFLLLLAFSDGNIRYYEYENDEMFFLSSYQSPEPQRGMAFLPKRSVNVSECEVVRAYKVTSSLVEPISFKVPRKVRNNICLLYEICSITD